MKVYISVDIEGITGVTSWEETEIDGIGSDFAKNQMTKEALAACQAAIEMGAKEVYIKDAHDTGRSLDLSVFPKEVKVIRQWTGEPVSMLAGLDSSFDALILIGYHSAAGQVGNPLAHTISRKKVHYIKINGEIVSEFDLNSMVAWERGVPTVFVSGDENLTLNAKKLIPKIETLAVKDGLGGASIDISPNLALELIKEGVKKGISKIDECKIELPDTFEVELSYKDHTMVNRARYYPGVQVKDAYSVSYKSKTMEDMMTTRMFIM